MLTIISQLESTLNEDGDFCIEGLNDSRSNINTDGDGQFTSLLDIEYSHQKSSKLSDILKGPQNQDDDIPFGEPFYMHRDSDTEIIEQFSFLSSGGQSMASGAAKDAKSWSSTNTHLPDCNQIDSTSLVSNSQDSSNHTLPISSRSQLVPEPSSTELDDEEQAAIQALEGFLHSIFDNQLHFKDIGNYAHELVAIGFDPDCEVSLGLDYDDLDFMKKLHQRFFWKEWQKLL